MSRWPSRDTDKRIAEACIVAEYSPRDMGVIEYLRAKGTRADDGR